MKRVLNKTNLQNFPRFTNYSCATNNKKVVEKLHSKYLTRWNFVQDIYALQVLLANVLQLPRE